MKKAVLFCNLPYAFSILKPICDELKKRKIEYIWYVPSNILSFFTYKREPFTSDIRDIEFFESDMIFVPGNDLPWYLKGLKVQIFHGLAGEKKGHFRIRDYFDLYLTQGPYFTKKFQDLAKKHKNFKVVETGWCKLDPLYFYDEKIKKKKIRMLEQSKAEKIVLYAPTFSPSLTSGEKLFESIVDLSKKDRYLVVIKFHDKMDKTIREKYEKVSGNKLVVLRDDDITDALKFSDILISDTSSVVYEFLLLDKPVITLNSKSKNIVWEDINEVSDLIKVVESTVFKNDRYKTKRSEIIKNYHPYNDGKSAQRTVEAAIRYIEKYGAPEKRYISPIRKLKMIKKFGLLRW